MKTETKDLEYWKNNCEEDYLHTPISVLRYIRELEEQSKLFGVGSSKRINIIHRTGLDYYFKLSDEELTSWEKEEILTEFDKVYKCELVK